MTPEEQTRASMQGIAQSVKEQLPPGWGFIVMAAPFEQADGRLNYVANIRREDAINLLKEWLLKAGAAEDWMQHIK